MEEIRYIQMCDQKFWSGLDRRLPEGEFEEKVRRRQGYILLEEGRPVGLLRYNLFWDNTPFCTLLLIKAGFRGKGFGRKLMEHWEKEMKAQGYGMLLTSAQSDEEAQRFYRKLGYRDCGGLIVDIPRYEQPMELFFIKAI